MLAIKYSISVIKAMTLHGSYIIERSVFVSICLENINRHFLSIPMISTASPPIRLYVLIVFLIKVKQVIYVH